MGLACGLGAPLDGPQQRGEAVARGTVVGQREAHPVQQEAFLGCGFGLAHGDPGQRTLLNDLRARAGKA